MLTHFARDIEVIDKSYGIMEDHFDHHEDEIRTTPGALYKHIEDWMELIMFQTF